MSWRWLAMAQTLPSGASLSWFTTRSEADSTLLKTVTRPAEKRATPA
jgi:hypothetical protein